MHYPVGVVTKQFAVILLFARYAGLFKVGIERRIFTDSLNKAASNW